MKFLFLYFDDKILLLYKNKKIFFYYYFIQRLILLSHNMFSFFINILEHNGNIEECLKKFCTEVKLFDVNLSIIPLFIETKINSTKCNFFHIPVNHHGISESNEFQSLCNLIQKNSFDKSDLLHYHIYRYKKPTKNKTINCEANKCQIIDFKTLPYGKN